MKIRKILLSTSLFIIFVFSIDAQVNDSLLINTSQKMAATNQKLSIGAYGQVDYNQPLSKGRISNGKLDVHRMILMINNKFNSRTSFFTEIEFEHVKEVFIEQAFINYKINKYAHIHAGLLLVPMGIINEYHESPTFNGVERPNLDNIIVPTTWREIGLGIAGRLDDRAIRYKAYLLNGFKSFDGSRGLLRGQDGLRKGRQKGAESIIRTPSLATKIDFYGISALKLGLSGYFGKTQSTLYQDLDKNDAFLKSQADSSIVGVSMLGLDARFSKKGWQFRGQFIYAQLSNTDQYNTFTNKDLGSVLLGYYLEAAYNVLQNTKFKTNLIPFIRIEEYNTQAKTDGLPQNLNYHKREVILGLGWKISPGAMLKLDYQRINNVDSDIYTEQLNAGVAIWY